MKTIFAKKLIARLLISFLTSSMPAMADQASDFSVTLIKADGSAIETTKEEKWSGNDAMKGSAQEAREALDAYESAMKAYKVTSIEF